jgi:methionyl-tRNA formyltransferase
MMKNLRVVFMGTPEFAVATLGALLINGIDVVGVVTAPDKPSGRGQKISKSAVKEFAEFSKLNIMQPGNLKDPGFIEKLKSLKADLFIVVAFRMLPEAVWKIPPMGTINLHASLLPDYRGAAPINHAIINGETVTGVTTFLIDEKIDTGKILLKDEISILPLENAGELHDRLMKFGARLVIKTIQDLADNKAVAIPQSAVMQRNSAIKSAPKIYPEDCNVNWTKDVIEVNNLVRGLSPYPCARSWFVNDKGETTLFKIFEGYPEVAEHKSAPGAIESDGKSFLKIACRNGYLRILSIQIEGKKKLNITDFLRGFRISDFSERTTTVA